MQRQVSERDEHEEQLKRLRAKIERLESERALYREAAVAHSRNAERLELALRASALGLWDWDLRTDRFSVNARWAHLIEHELDDIGDQITAWHSRVHPDDMERLYKAFRSHRGEQTEFYEVEHRLRTRSGAWHWVVARGRIVERGEEGRPVRMAGTLQDISERKHAEELREDLIRELRRTLAKVKTLSGLLPICASCKKIRDDAGYWQQIEEYLAAATDLEFSHGLCPRCLANLYPEINGGSDQPTAP